MNQGIQITGRLSLLLLLVMVAQSCQRSKMPTQSRNLELTRHENASRLLSPGMGTIGLIENDSLKIFYLNEYFLWQEDPASGFAIPVPNDGLLAMGSGMIALKTGRNLSFFRMTDDFHWENLQGYDFPLPRKYSHIMAVRMPWEMGVIAIETGGFLDFYYHDEVLGWQLDETARIAVPEGIIQYFSLGGMTVAIVDRGLLGVYYLHAAGDWRFLDEHVLELPPGYEAVLPYEPGIIAVLLDNRLVFHELDLENEVWIVDEAMDFVLP